MAMGAASAIADSPAIASVCIDRKSTRLNSSHDQISYAVFCLKKKKKVVPPRSDLKTTDLDCSDGHRDHPVSLWRQELGRRAHDGGVARWVRGVRAVRAARTPHAAPRVCPHSSTPPRLAAPLLSPYVI